MNSSPTERILRKNFSFYIKAAEGMIDKIDRTIAAVANQFNLPVYQAYVEIFWWGVEAAQDKLEDEDARHAAKVLTTRTQLLKRAREIDKDDRELRVAIRNLGPDKIRKIAEEFDLDPEVTEQLIESAMVEEKSYSGYTEREVWIDEYLADGEVHHTGDIQNDAIRAGVLSAMNEPEFKPEWDQMKSIASRAGYTKNAPHSMWRKVVM